MTGGPVDYVLGNGEDLHRAHPRSFFIPAREVRESLQPGDLAKLRFEISDSRADLPGSERMWVEVTGHDSDGYAGTLVNHPTAITTITYGSTVRFGPEHVISIRGDEDWPLLDKKVLVSRRSHELDLRPRWVYRETPDRDMDSGWRALVGDETDAELDDPENILLQQLGFVLDRWPELRPVFQTDLAHSEWSWDEQSGCYVAVPSA
jgi:hypothetical protein